MPADATSSQKRIVLGTLPELRQRQSLTSHDLRSTLTAKSGLSRQVQLSVQGAWSAEGFSDQYFIDRAGGYQRALVGDDMKHSAMKIEPAGEPVAHQVAAMDFYCKKEDLTVNRQPMNESYCAAIVEGYALSLICSGKGKEKLEEVEGSLNTLIRTTSSTKP
jgi:hypothetical protein